MKKYTEKSITDSVRDVDTTSRRVKVAISHMGSLDHDGDIIDHKAYRRTIDQRGPKGANLIWHLTDHNPSLKSAVGKFKELYVEGEHLVGVTDIPATNWGNDVLEFYKSGTINQHSVGFKTLDSEIVNKGKADEHRLIKEIFLYEGSAVLWGANENTPTLAKSMTPEEREKEYFATLKEVNNLAKAMKSGHFTDDTFELLEIKLTQATDKLKQLFENATQPAVNAPDPVNESLLDVFKTFNNTLITESWMQTNCKPNLTV